MSLTALHVTASVEEVNAVIERDGGVVIEGYVPDDALNAIRDDMMPVYETVDWGGDFLGDRTRRFGCLFQYSTALSALVEQPHFLGAAEHFLRTPSKVWHGEHLVDQVPDYHLSLTQAIAIHPGQGHQPLHRDDVLLFNPHPGPQVRVQMMFALTDFTAENGGTNVVAGSHRWDSGRGPRIEEAVPTEMKAGSALIWLGGVYHGGGLNTSENDVRHGITMAFDRAHLNWEENHFVVYDRETVEALPPLTRRLLGYEEPLGYWGYVLVDGKIKGVGDLLARDRAAPNLSVPS
ncbi:phytanoyl-CoA dioxygenase family protein [Rhodococcus sp. HNM0569]|uniref:phytanoyl-CoA dioxygenase family protein n=1 Tax=Rhodococcus sp. HNM0569 TaxID=2716340 RepID=UPI00146B1CC9|nr:phytanoyl-CoA dioxygenase family protein [Rhodococcus sp. HNM0569]NLU82728.1 phytanoyl-CoA dioxygenase family protein [Rhodococcus sp. HNM0569]